MSTAVSTSMSTSMSTSSSSEIGDEWENVSEDEYLRTQLGPQQLSFNVVVPITILYALIFVSGLLGNVCVCVVITRISSMHTSINYYLFSLAVSDLLLLIFGLPNDVLLFWHQYPWLLGEAVCKLRALISEATSNASVLTIVAFTTERYVAICKPMLTQTMSSLPRVVAIIGLTWVVALLSAAPFAFFTRVHYADYPPGSGRLLEKSAFCSVPPEASHVLRPLLCFSSFAFFLIPVFVIVALYIRIGLALRESAGMLSNEGNQGDGKRRVILSMLVAVVIAFVICWTPFHAQRLLFVYDDAREWPKSLRLINEVLYYAGGFYYFNCTINPILYNVMSAKYREAFRETLCGFLVSPPVTPSSRRSSRRTKASWDHDGCQQKENGFRPGTAYIQENTEVEESVESKSVEATATIQYSSSGDKLVRFLWSPLVAKLRFWMKPPSDIQPDYPKKMSIVEENRPHCFVVRFRNGSNANSAETTTTRVSAFSTEVELGIVQETQV